MSEYHIGVKKRDVIKLRELAQTLPNPARAFLRSMAETKQSRTLVAYALDLNLFIDFLKQSGRPSGDDFAANITADDIIDFIESVSLYKKRIGDRVVTRSNDIAGKARKISAVRSMFCWLYKRGYITSDPSAVIEVPRIREKAIIALEPNEAANLLDEVESGSGLTGREVAFHKNRACRDLAIMTLLLGTGMRVSECVAIDIGHVDLEENAVKITRKGGNEAILFFSEEVSKALADYIVQRKSLDAASGHEKALFLNRFNTRVSAKTIQNIVKQYSRIAVPLKKITPHKLRSSYGTSLYRESGDIYLVADVLGHKDVNTTKRHYARIDEEQRRKAAKYVKLRDE